MAPEISVVLPVRDAQSTVERAVRSILQQTLAEIELIVIDDGSTDRTTEIVAQISDHRLHVKRTKPRGVVAAANLGTQRAQAPIIARMDADDWAHPARLATQWDYLEQNNLDVVGCRVRIESTAGPLTDGMLRYQRWINEDTLTPKQIHALRFVELPLVNPSVLARRRYFEFGFKDNALPEDYDLMLRAAGQGMKFGKTPEVLLTWADSPGRLTRTHSRYSEEAFMECRRFHVLNGPLRGVSCVDLWGAGRTGKPWLRWLQNQNITVRKVIEVSERKKGQVIHGVPVIAPEILKPPDGTPMLVAVGTAGARALIDSFVSARSYQTGHDVWFVA